MSTTTTQTRAKKSGKVSPRKFSARVKCEAVLSVWSERRKPSEVCRELEINWANLSHWQNVALAAMLEALKPRDQEKPQRPALGTKLEKLLERTETRTKRLNRLEKRLETIQQAGPKPTSKP